MRPLNSYSNIKISWQQCLVRKSDFTVGEYIGTTRLWLIPTRYYQQKGQGIKHLSQGKNVFLFTDG